MTPQDLFGLAIACLIAGVLTWWLGLAMRGLMWRPGMPMEAEPWKDAVANMKLFGIPALLLFAIGVTLWLAG